MKDQDDPKATEKIDSLAPESEVQRISKLISRIKESSATQSTSLNSTSDTPNNNIDNTEERIPQTPRGTHVKASTQDQNDLYTKTISDLDILISSYIPKGDIEGLKSDILSEFDKILLRQSESVDAEINISTILSNSDTQKINDLFLLIETELSSTTKKFKVKDIPLSKTKTLHKEELEEIFQELGEKVIKEFESEKTHHHSDLEMDEIPFAGFSYVFFPFIFDTIIFSLVSIYFTSQYTKNPIDLNDPLPFILSEYKPIVIAFFATWFLIQALSLILVQATFTQSLVRIIVVDDNNRNPSILTLLKRLSLHFFNFLTIGIYSCLIVKYILGKNKKGIYCPISKTTLSFKGFAKDSK